MTTTFRPHLSTRVQDLPPYLFAEIERKVAARRAAGVDIISLGIGDPDTPTPAHIVAAMHEGVDDPRSHQYPTNRGTAEFRAAVASYYSQRFGVELDEQTEIVPLLGAKEGIAHLGFALLDPGRRVPRGRSRLPGLHDRAGARRRHGVHLPLRPELGFQPALDDVDPAVLSRARMIFVSYPNNPTGAVIEDDFFARLVAFAREHDIVVVHDNAYADITFDGYVAPSFLETPGAKEVGVELFSLSKSYSMTGWRAGAIVGRSDVVDAYWRLKTNMDSGMFAALQHAAAVALTGPQDSVAALCRLYAHRRDLLVTALREAGMQIAVPKGTIYLWAPVPDGHTSGSFAELVLDQADVIVSPGAAYGPSGEGYVRFSLTVPDERLRAAVERIVSRVKL